LDSDKSKTPPFCLATEFEENGSSGSRGRVSLLKDWLGYLIKVNDYAEEKIYKPQIQDFINLSQKDHFKKIGYVITNAFARQPLIRPFKLSLYTTLIKSSYLTGHRDAKIMTFFIEHRFSKLNILSSHRLDVLKAAAH